MPWLAESLFETTFGSLAPPKKPRNGRTKILIDDIYQHLPQNWAKNCCKPIDVLSFQVILNLYANKQ